LPFIREPHKPGPTPRLCPACLPATTNERQARAYLSSFARLAYTIGWDDLAAAALDLLDLARSKTLAQMSTR